MLSTNRIEKCSSSDICHFVPHFPVSSKEKSGNVRIVGNFINLNKVINKMNATSTTDPLQICKNSAKYKHRCKIDLTKALI